ncbi:MAG: alpha/beta fold hydrolase [Opitutales bacterium]|nr:alpha/beta fold hydrolase [Opitutales bacterium]
MTTKAVKLHAECYGDPALAPLVVLHGMLGSGRNWASMAKRLGDRFAVWAVDLRNHGASPHAAEMGYPAMAADLAAFLDRNDLCDPVLIGHSMGGKTAMRFAVGAPERVRGLVVVDIAPKPYAPRWEKEFAALRALDLGTLRSRSEAEARLEPAIPDWAFRKFLTTNLVRDAETKAFRWAVNLDGLHAALPRLFEKGLGDDERYGGPALFVRGGRSRFVEPGDFGVIRRHFPRARLETVEDAGHNVHFDAPDAFAERLCGWIGTDVAGHPAD